MRKGTFLVFAIVFILTTYLIRHFGFKTLVVSDQVSQNEKSPIVKNEMAGEGYTWLKQIPPIKTPDSIVVNARIVNGWHLSESVAMTDSSLTGAEIRISSLRGATTDSVEVYLSLPKEKIKSPMFIPK